MRICKSEVRHNAVNGTPLKDRLSSLCRVKVTVNSNGNKQKKLNVNMIDGLTLLN